MLGGVFAFGAGFLCLASAVNEQRTMSRLHRYGVRTQGRVIGAVLDDSSEVPVIAFTDNVGNRIEFRPKIAGIGLQLPIGLEVPIAYPEGRPLAARIFTTRYRVLPIVFPVIVGLIFVVAGVAIIAA
jgi:hypothetical protein